MAPERLYGAAVGADGRIFGAGELRLDVAVGPCGDHKAQEVRQAIDRAGQQLGHLGPFLCGRLIESVDDEHPGLVDGKLRATGRQGGADDSAKQRLG